METKIFFNDDRLNKVIAKHNKSVDEISNQLDKISGDIKRLESVLKKCPLEDFEYKIPESTKGEYLYWSEQRIHYYASDVASNKPLIEQKSFARVRVMKHLAPFFEAAMAKLEEQCQE